MINIDKLLQPEKGTSKIMIYTV